MHGACLSSHGVWHPVDAAPAMETADCDSAEGLAIRQGKKAVIEMTSGCSL